ncbi:cysteinyl-tRNA synthetase [Paenibacillus forsythiae]|uniref:Cysteine--tRNA ligase n=1 Tax=Paenibacillus forsythiae TaxID=365616 RepID=A0ABU3HAB4_9BACL|nr:cysteine--tRNA ligase [Paenibacillus forsythiae]MDT3427766.1 cysteinyl-tRNA synthetase [Paenibacillus forsythiae]
MQVFNTLTREKENFQPYDPNIVTMYVCGVTVYGPVHLGHARTAIAYDMIRGVLEVFKGYKVIHVQNITDVGHIVGDVDTGEDKIQRKANLEQKHPMAIVDEYIQNMWSGYDALKIARPTIAPRATGHIIEIIDAIKELIAKGFAYEVEGDVYFDVLTRESYGILSGNAVDMLAAGARIEVNGRKRNPGDFALWKKAEPNHIMQWSSPWGKGYPGWHIECSVMSLKYLGKIDIHGGAVELCFPHHENEIAQSEALVGERVVQYWLHSGVLQINGQKMAKSLGNYITIEEALKKHSAESLRFFILSNHYSAMVNMSDDSLASAKAALKRINNYLFNLHSRTGKVFNQLLHIRLHEWISCFEAELENDFDTPNAIAHLFNFLRDTNHEIIRGNYNEVNFREIWEYFSKINQVFKCFDMRQDLNVQADKGVQASSIEALVLKRAELRKNKSWAEADAVKNELSQMGVTLFDNRDGSTTYKLACTD